jgi:hypothetical protein
MKSVLLLLLISPLLLLVTPASAQTKKYTGAWFDIFYPANFKVKPSQKSPSAEGYESAFFISPDKTAEFYVFSPQWNGDPADISLKPATEKETNRKTTKDVNGTDITWFTIEANNKTYTRTYEESLNETYNTRRVVGIKYKNQAAYKKYKTAYLAFKKSLIQYAD